MAAELERLPASASVALYGCGGLASTLVDSHAPVLAGVRNLQFVVTQRQSETFRGYPLAEASELSSAPPDVLVLLSAMYEHEMRAALPCTDPPRVVSLHDIFQGDALEHVRAAIHAELCAHIESERGRILSRLPAGRPLVVFATPQAALHAVKHVAEITKAGYATLFAVERAEVVGGLTLRELEDQGHVHAVFESRFVYPLEVVELLSGLDVHVVHAEAGMWSALPLSYLVERLPCPVVVEYRDFKELVFASDTAARQTLRLSPTEFEAEQAAMRRVFLEADGVLYKESPEALILLEQRHGAPPRDALHFLHFVSDSFAAPCDLPKYSRVDGRPHLVYAGNVVNDPAWHNYPVFSSLLRAAEMLAEQRIHLTVFNAVDATGKGFQDYLDLDDRCPYFHYRFAMPYAALASELPRYDFGWLVFDFSNARESPQFLRTTMASKVFSYVECGLPILVSPEQVYMADLVERLGVGVAVRFEDLGRLGRRLDSLDGTTLRSGLERVGREWTYSHQLPRLLKWYEEVARRPRRPYPGTN